MGPGEQLDKAALVAGLGGRFSPGIDITYISREPDLYVQNWQSSGTGPFRINLKPVNYNSVTEAPFLSLGWMSGAPFCWLLIEAFGNYRPLYVVVMALNLVVALLLTIWMLRRRATV